jgi:hypothetical protein
MADFGKWLVETPRVTKSMCVRKLAELRHRRWAWYHIYCENGGVIHPSMGMLPYSATALHFIFSCSERAVRGDVGVRGACESAYMRKPWWPRVERPQDEPQQHARVGVPQEGRAVDP